jgi:hypothetical protein
VEPLEGDAPRRSIGSTVDVSGVIADPCVAAQQCSHRFRLTALLLDPSVKTAAVQWGASVQVQPGRDLGRSAMPAGGKLTASADAVETRPRADLVVTTLDPETIRLDVDHPGVSRLIELDQPGGPAMSGDRLWFAYLVLRDPTPDQASPFALGVHVTRGDERTPIVDHAFAGLTPFPPADCAGREPCTTALRVDLGLPRDATVADAAWTIGVVALGGEPSTPPGPAAVRVIDRFDPGPDVAHLSAEVSGEADVVNGSPLNRAPAIALDASDVPQATGRSSGWLQARLTMKANPSAGAKRLNVGVGSYGAVVGIDQQPSAVPSSSATLEPGGTATMTSALIRYACTGRTRCEIGAPIFAVAPDAGSAVHVRWTLTAVWWPDLGSPIAPDLRLTIADRPGPSSR